MSTFKVHVSKDYLIFCAAHFVTYDGVCEPLHGHNYRASVTLEGDTLSIHGEFKAPMENVEYVFQERSFGKFSRTLTINVPVDVNKVEATFDSGVLTITLPKAEAARPKTIKVEAKK